MPSRFLSLIILLLCSVTASAQTTLTSGKLEVTFTPQQGMTQVQLDGRTVMTGSSTHFAGSLFTLLRNTPTRDWNWPDRRDTPHYAPSIGRLVDKVGHWKKPKIRVIESAAGRYAVEHRFEQG